MAKYNLGGGTFSQILATVNAADQRRKDNEKKAMLMMEMGFRNDDAREEENLFSQVFSGGPEFRADDWSPDPELHQQLASTERTRMTNEAQALMQQQGIDSREALSLQDIEANKALEIERYQNNLNVQIQRDSDARTRAETLQENTTEKERLRQEHEINLAYAKLNRSENLSPADLEAAMRTRPFIAKTEEDLKDELAGKRPWWQDWFSSSASAFDKNSIFYGGDELYAELLRRNIPVEDWDRWQQSFRKEILARQPQSFEDQARLGTVDAWAKVLNSIASDNNDLIKPFTEIPGSRPSPATTPSFATRVFRADGEADVEVPQMNQTEIQMNQPEIKDTRRQSSTYGLSPEERSTSPLQRGSFLGKAAQRAKGVRAATGKSGRGPNRGRGR